jgi:hypothetical protein
MGTFIEWEALADLGLLGLVMLTWLASKVKISRKEGS